MNQIDFNPKVARKDAYGHVTVKPTTYRGFTLDVGITVKVWNPCDQYMGRFANVKAAKAAHDVTEGKNASIIDTSARALWDTGKKAEAIKHQTRAVELAKEARIRKQFTETLERYKKEAPKPTSQAAAK